MMQIEGKTVNETWPTVWQRTKKTVLRMQRWQDAAVGHSSWNRRCDHWQEAKQNRKNKDRFCHGSQRTLTGHEKSSGQEMSSSNVDLESSPEMHQLWKRSVILQPLRVLERAHIFYTWKNGWLNISFTCSRFSQAIKLSAQN